MSLLRRPTRGSGDCGGPLHYCRGSEGDGRGSEADGRGSEALDKRAGVRTPQRNVFAVLLLFAVVPLAHSGPGAILWTAPAIRISAVMIAWAAESAQFFIAQGFALAILAWLQTAPEFAVEGVIAWHRDVPLLLANLTGALR